jgi:hypothetical protein
MFLWAGPSLHKDFNTFSIYLGFSQKAILLTGSQQKKTPALRFVKIATHHLMEVFPRPVIQKMIPGIEAVK